jgi:pyruvate,orthophosphate dikinase
VRYFEGEQAVADGDELVQAVRRLIAHADATRALGVRTNADTPEDAQRARRFGAEGIGLCRTSTCSSGDRRQLVEDLVLADDASRGPALQALLPLQREDFEGILRAMDGLPVTIRLLDPPLHEFLPSLVELEVEVAVAEAGGADVDPAPPHPARRRPAAARAEPDDRHPRCAARAGHRGAVRDAGAGAGGGRRRRSRPRGSTRGRR